MEEEKAKKLINSRKHIKRKIEQNPSYKTNYQIRMSNKLCLARLTDFAKTKSVNIGNSKHRCSIVKVCNSVAMEGNDLCEYLCHIRDNHDVGRKATRLKNQLTKKPWPGHR